MPAFSDDLVQVTVLVNQSDYFPDVDAAFSAVGTSPLDDAVTVFEWARVWTVECPDGSHRQINDASFVPGNLDADCMLKATRPLP
jgi:hypothetical protein